MTFVPVRGVGQLGGARHRLDPALGAAVYSTDHAFMRFAHVPGSEPNNRDCRNHTDSGPIKPMAVSAPFAHAPRDVGSIRSAIQDNPPAHRVLTAHLPCVPQTARVRPSPTPFARGRFYITAVRRVRLQPDQVRLKADPTYSSRFCRAGGGFSSVPVSSLRAGLLRAAGSADEETVRRR
jgi:hypothetical protein